MEQLEYFAKVMDMVQDSLRPPPTEQGEDEEEEPVMAEAEA